MMLLGCLVLLLLPTMANSEDQHQPQSTSSFRRYKSDTFRPSQVHAAAEEYFDRAFVVRHARSKNIHTFVVFPKIVKDHDRNDSKDHDVESDSIRPFLIVRPPRSKGFDESEMEPVVMDNPLGFFSTPFFIDEQVDNPFRPNIHVWDKSFECRLGTTSGTVREHDADSHVAYHINIIDNTSFERPIDVAKDKFFSGVSFDDDHLHGNLEAFEIDSFSLHLVRVCYSISTANITQDGEAKAAVSLGPMQPRIQTLHLHVRHKLTVEADLLNTWKERIWCRGPPNLRTSPSFFFGDEHVMEECSFTEAWPTANALSQPVSPIIEGPLSTTYTAGQNGTIYLRGNVAGWLDVIFVDNDGTTLLIQIRMATGMWLTTGQYEDAVLSATDESTLDLALNNCNGNQFRIRIFPSLNTEEEERTSQLIDEFKTIMNLTTASSLDFRLGFSLDDLTYDHSTGEVRSVSLQYDGVLQTDGSSIEGSLTFRQPNIFTIEPNSLEPVKLKTEQPKLVVVSPEKVMHISASEMNMTSAIVTSPREKGEGGIGPNLIITILAGPMKVELTLDQDDTSNALRNGTCNYNRCKWAGNENQLHTKFNFYPFNYHAHDSCKSSRWTFHIHSMEKLTQTFGNHVDVQIDEFAADFHWICEDDESEEYFGWIRINSKLPLTQIVTASVEVESKSLKSSDPSPSCSLSYVFWRGIRNPIWTYHYNKHGGSYDWYEGAAYVMEQAQDFDDGGSNMMVFEDQSHQNQWQDLYQDDDDEDEWHDLYEQHDDGAMRNGIAWLIAAAGTALVGRALVVRRRPEPRYGSIRTRPSSSSEGVMSSGGDTVSEENLAHELGIELREIT